MYITICEIDRQSGFNAWDRELRAGALGWPWEMGRWRSWEGGLGWGIHVHPWLIHVNVWQKPVQYCKVISLQLNKLIKKKDYHRIQQFHFQVSTEKQWTQGLKHICVHPCLQVLAVHRSQKVEGTHVHRCMPGWREHGPAPQWSVIQP